MNAMNDLSASQAEAARSIRAATIALDRFGLAMDFMLRAAIENLPKTPVIWEFRRISAERSVPLLDAIVLLEEHGVDEASRRIIVGELA